jgi:hypothetical protein
MARASVVKLEIANLHEFIANLERMERQAERGMSAALRSEADHMMDRADVLVPVATGALRGSRFIGLVHRWSRGLEIRFGYSSPYGVYQHFGHYEHDDGRRLFLEQPVKYSRRGLVSRIKMVLARFL